MADGLGSPMQPERRPPASHGVLETERVAEFRLIRLLGRGGMGAVYQAEDTILQRPTAIKLINPQYASDAIARARFLREARSQAGINHDNVVQIYQVGESEGRLFIAMPLLHGEALDQRLKRDHVAPLSLCLKVARDVADGLAAAHEQAIIHRDIKPSNLWLDGNPQAAEFFDQVRRVKILDFGLARSTDDLSARLTSNRDVIGSPPYMSPERVNQEELTPQADLYSLGVVLYEMTTGRVPFHGPHAMAIFAKVLTRVPAPVRLANPSVPSELSDLIDSLLAKRPDDRPDSAVTVLAEIEEIAQRHGMQDVLVRPPRSSVFKPLPPSNTRPVSQIETVVTPRPSVIELVPAKATPVPQPPSNRWREEESTSQSLGPVPSNLIFYVIALLIVLVGVAIGFFLLGR